MTTLPFLVWAFRAALASPVVAHRLHPGGGMLAQITAA